MVDFDTVWHRIREAAGAKTDAELGAFLGIGKGGVGKQRRAKNIPTNWLGTIYEKTGLTREELYRDAPAPPPAALSNGISVTRYEDLPRQMALSTNDNKLVLLVTVPVLGTVPAGTPQDISGSMAQYAEDYISVSGVPPSSLGLRVGGDSMTRPDGTGIRQGDVVVFVPGQEPVHRNVVVVNTEAGESVLRRYVVEQGRVYLDANNPEYERITPNGGYRVVGVVIDVVRKIPLD